MKDYEMKVLYHPDKDNVVADAQSRLMMYSVSHREKAKKDLVKDFHRLARWGVRLEDSSNGGFMIHNNSESSLVVRMKSKQHLDKSLVDFKQSVLGNINETLSLKGWYF